MAGSQKQSDETNLALMRQNMEYIQADVEAIKVALQTNYVTKDQFQPVRKIAYGAVTLLSLIVVGLLGLIATLKGKP